MFHGSRARGDGAADPDYDIAVSLRDFRDRSPGIDCVIPVVTDVLYGDGSYSCAGALSQPHALNGRNSPSIDL